MAPSPTLSSGIYNQISANWRTSGFLAEVDGSLAGVSSVNQTALIITQKLAAGTAVAGAMNLIPGDGSMATDLCGAGSMGEAMVKAFRAINRTTTLNMVALDDLVAGTVATTTVTASGVATKAGQINLHIGTLRIRAAVAIGDDATAVAASIVAAVTADPSMPVTAANVLGVVTLTFRHKGEAGNGLRVVLNRLGELGGERTPTGVAVAIAGDGYLTNGSGNPVLTAAIAAMGDQEHDFIIHAYTDTASLDDLNTELERRWAPDSMLYGMALGARSGTLSELATFGGARNDKFLSDIEAHNAACVYERAALYGAWLSFALANHAARPLCGLVLNGDPAPSPEEQFIATDRNTLLFTGVSTSKVVANAVQIDRAITHYRVNTSGSADTAWLDVTTLTTNMAVIRDLRHHVQSTYIDRRCLLVDDGTRIDPIIPHCSPSIVEASLIAQYAKLEYDGLVENAAAFAARLRVGRDPNDQSRLNMLYTPDYTNPLYLVATQVGFSLQWPADLVA